MRLTGRRESNNVEDRRGMGTGAKAGIGGIGGIIVIALITFFKRWKHGRCSQQHRSTADARTN